MRISPALREIRSKQKLFLVKKKKIEKKMTIVPHTSVAERMFKADLQEKAIHLLSDIQTAISNEECRMEGDHIIDLDSKLGMDLALPLVVKALQQAYKLGKIENE